MASDVMAPIKRKKTGSSVLNDIAKIGSIGLGVAGLAAAPFTGGASLVPAAEGAGLIATGAGAAKVLDELTPDEKVEEIRKNMPEAVNNLDAMKRRFEAMNKGGGFF